MTLNLPAADANASRVGVPPTASRMPPLGDVLQQAKFSHISLSSVRNNRQDPAPSPDRCHLAARLWSSASQTFRLLHWWQHQFANRDRPADCK